jgi:superfamily II RNA helicase
MVKICPDYYPTDGEFKYSEYFDKYSFSLSSFQKYAIESIVEGHHILVTAHTGSGKTLPAEFAIEYFVSKGKKVIYTSPIKALSNQKFYEFSQKFPHISFGILTGDLKTNPEADVLIMTTEILMNALYAKNKKNSQHIGPMFEMDFNTELACVVFDEVHYINDTDRGKVWEETIIMLPKHIQMIMLSATLNSPEKFALWCETRGLMKDINTNDITENDKIVYLTSTYERVVPLTHYSFITCTQGLFKVLKNKELEREIMKTTNKLHMIQDSKGNFNEQNYQTISKTLKIFNDKNHYVKRQHVLNTVCNHMFENNMLPAICFVLSRKALEKCAKEITTDLLEDDSKVPYTIRRECEQIIRKLPNYSEYINLPEYLNMVALLEKGIAIHHAGIIPILREMVELLFAKGYVKLLFATETFAVGINMPTKTVIFTDLNKFDGSNMRNLYSHEYTQMAGRAGRRGIDKVGHVIHLTNLFKNMDQISTKLMLNGKPQLLVSKFKISYNLILNLVDIGETDYIQYTKRSMIQTDLNKLIVSYYISISKLQIELNNLTIVLNNSKTPFQIVEEYIELQDQKVKHVNKQRKEIERNIRKIQDEYKNVDNDIESVLKYKKNKQELDCLYNDVYIAEKSLEINVSRVLKLLKDDKYVSSFDDVTYELTFKGQIATLIRETHCLVFADIIISNTLQNFEAKELVGILSCFTNVSIQDEIRCILPTSQYSNVKECIDNIYLLYQNQLNNEIRNSIDTGFDYSMHFDLIDYCIAWCDCTTDIECKQLLQQIETTKSIFLGEFIKAILKINNIAFELEKVAELIGNIEFLATLRLIPQLTLKYVATNQSLYV